MEDGGKFGEDALKGMRIEDMIYHRDGQSKRSGMGGEKGGENRGGKVVEIRGERQILNRQPELAKLYCPRMGNKSSIIVELSM